MKDFIICTENTSDLPLDYVKENNIGVINFTYMIDGETYGSYQDLPYKEFYSRVRAGSMPTTSQVNPEEGREFLEKYLDQGYDILHISFSSGLSGTCNNMKLVAQELNEERQDCKIIVIDTLAASMGEGLLVHQAVKMKQRGKSMDEIAQWIEEHKLNLVHLFTVDDLNHLCRGGRVSKTTALIGTMVNIKPVLHVDNEGHLVALDKVRGRKKSLQTLVDYMSNQMGSYVDKNEEVFISHGDCEEDAQYVANLVKEKFGIEKFLINPVCATVGAHSGPGTIALFFMGDKR